MTMQKFKQGLIVPAIIGILLSIVIPPLRRATTTERTDVCCSFCGSRAIRTIDKGVVSLTESQMNGSIPSFEHEHFWIADGKVVRESLFGGASFEKHVPGLFVILLELQTYAGLFGARKDDSRLIDFYLKQISKLPVGYGSTEVETLRKTIVSHPSFAGLKAVTSEDQLWKTLDAINATVTSINRTEKGDSRD